MPARQVTIVVRRHHGRGLVKSHRVQVTQDVGAAKVGACHELAQQPVSLAANGGD